MIVLGMIAGIILPFFNIPLMLRIRRRESSNDISLIWTYGVFTCVLLMLPSAILSQDLVFKLFAIANTFLFGGVVYFVIKYRRKNGKVNLQQ